MNKNNSIVSGVGLVALGAIFMVSQFVEFNGLFFLLLLGLGFIGWSVLGRNKGLMIPGGILFGIGLGTILDETALSATLGGDAGGGLFLIGFAIGWFLITALTKLFFNDFQWWPLIPGGIMAIIGVGLITDGALLTTIGSVGRWWPLILIVIGVSIIWSQFRKDEEAALKDKDDLSYEKGPEDLVG
ncbi:MAG: hypothetical protein AAF902_15005 [Chloroflexota bacterium]